MKGLLFHYARQVYRAHWLLIVLKKCSNPASHIALCHWERVIIGKNGINLHYLWELSENGWILKLYDWKKDGLIKSNAEPDIWIQPVVTEWEAKVCQNLQTFSRSLQAEGKQLRRGEQILGGQQFFEGGRAPLLALPWLWAFLFISILKIEVMMYFHTAH